MDLNVVASKAEGNKEQKGDYDLNDGEEEEHRSRQTGESGIRKED